MKVHSQQAPYEEIKAYHAALSNLLAMYVTYLGDDDNCVYEALKILARHRELPIRESLAQRIEQLFPEEETP